MSTSKPSASANQLAGLAHVLGVFTSIIAPLVIWGTNSAKDPQVEANAKEALNFQITVMAAHIINSVLTFVLFFIWPAFAWAVSLVIWAVCIYWAILGYTAANEGKKYRYPFAFRIIA